MQVSRPVLIAAAATFAALLAAVCFLLGRESARRRPPRVSAPSTLAVTEPAPPPAAPPPLPLPPPAASTSSPSPVVLVVPPSAPPLPTVGPVPSPPPAHVQPPVQPPIRMNLAAVTPPAAPSGSDNEDEATAVRDYFLHVQAIQATAPSTDTNEFASKLLSSSMTGDTSGLDELVRVTEEGERRVQALSPPAACADYHQRLLSMLGESASMVRQLKTALTSKDARGLDSLSATGSSLQARANALDQQARQIKAEYGVAH